MEVGVSKHASMNIALVQAREALMTNFRPILNEAGVTEQQWRIIRLVAENGTSDFQSLAEDACILRPSLTGILVRLEKNGYLVRLKPANDQRRVFIKLTDAGKRLYQEIGSRVDERYDAIERVMGKSKMEQLRGLLSDLHTARHPLPPADAV
ncbi:homoprotocatechuate degradation operon regulator HpaR [Neisseria leonii]|uniref:Homoprotocatechuate degradation operon regulator HpaR n=1 Tax=Neisseria leonii TaxID=2995413 RepID=A0A9X4E1T2_9NEIS|nr:MULTISPECIES: homoprotocatechuate degradation operon regulator HpaR [unclassified Neisseria]MDD9325937.1 homoprotocatechuate degradation operon regulator HpaR [Neisseria sp. 3986]MDD9327935.1 homoprotocatechuate degradation operon regulator HpaR [Neisseria sp. 51.81]